MLEGKQRCQEERGGDRNEGLNLASISQQTPFAGWHGGGSRVQVEQTGLPDKTKEMSQCRRVQFEQEESTRRAEGGAAAKGRP